MLFESLEHAHEHRVYDAKRTRDVLEADVFTFAGRLIQSDDRSVARINSATLRARGVSPVNRDRPMLSWRDKSNAAMPLTANEVIDMQRAMSTFHESLHNHYRTIRALLDAATTIDEIMIVDVINGWPSAR